MRFTGISCLALLALAACSDPLRDVPRLSEVQLQEDAGAAQALPSAAESSEEGGFFERLTQRSASPVANASTVAADDTAAPAPVATSKARRGGILARLTQRRTAEPAALPDANPSQDASEAAAAKAPEQSRGGLLGFLSNRAEAGKAQPTTPAEPPVQTAALAPESAPETQSDRSGGLFGGLLGTGGAKANAPDPDAPDYRQIGPGVTLPYGELARLCGAPQSVLGKKVASYPESRGIFTLHDTQPGNTAPHTFFVTGFDDGCARQFTAALAIFGSPVLHEQLRYGLPAKVQPYSTTDEAYEKLKSRVCRVGKGKPCGNAMSKMERKTTFLSVYERFGSNPRWKTLLLHDGSVVATDIKN